jgi:hypothetical protein
MKLFLFLRPKLKKMPGINIQAAHSLGKEAAMMKIKSLLSKLKSDHNDMVNDLEEEWNPDGSVFSFRIMGMKVKGSFKVAADYIVIQGDLPLAALPFKKTIEDRIREEAVQLLQ